MAVAVAAWLLGGGADTTGVARGGRPRTSPRRSASGPRTPAPQSDRRRPLTPLGLAADLNLTERAIDSPASPPGALSRAGLVQELATGILARMSAPGRRTTLAHLTPEARAEMRTDLAAAGALAGLAEHPRHLPPWRIVAPPPPARLLRDFRAAQSRTGVPWTYLAAIELVESRMGRIRGPSSAGAQGPMQFLPATWARYGRGNINDPRAAILGAARFLVANGAPGDMAGALFHYNHSLGYVAAVRAYARQMQRDPRAYDGYYEWPVIFGYDDRTVRLPLGFPSSRPTPIRGLPAPPPVG